MRKAYSQAECDYLIANYRTTSYRVIAEHLGRSYASVQQKAAWFDLKRTAAERSRIMSGWSRQPKVSAAPTTPATPPELVPHSAAHRVCAAGAGGAAPTQQERT